MTHIHPPTRVLMSLTFCLVLALTNIVWADTSTPVVLPEVLISEVMPDKTAADKTDEFIELYNTSNKVMAAQSLQVQIYASTATAWSDKPYRTVTLSHDFLPGKHYLIASSVYLPDTAYDSYGSSLTATIGHIRVIDIASQQQEDFIEWGDPLKAHVFQLNNTFAPVLLYPGTISQSLKRKVNEDGQFVYSGFNGSDFSISAAPTPQADNMLPDGYVVATEQPPIDTSSQPTPAVLANVHITELLPDPVAPQADANDEFIEIYNADTQDANLKGYILETMSGATVHDYTFTTDTILPADMYTAFFSSQTHLALSNSGSQVRLLDSKKVELDTAEAYPTALAGQAWALVDGVWQWTETPTPNAVNNITGSSTPKATSVATRPTTKTSTAAKAKTTAVAKPRKVATQKAVATKKKKVVKTANFDNTAAALASAPIHTKVLAAVALAAVLYGLYEYRSDLSNQYHIVRANRAARRAARAQPGGRGSV